MFTSFLNKLYPKIESKNIQILYTSIGLAIFCLLIIRILLVFSYSPDIVVGEDNNIWNIQKMLLGGNLYTNPEKIPYEVFQYSPLSQIPLFWITKLLYLRPGEDVYQMFVIGRLLSLLYNVLFLFYFYKILYRILNVEKLYSFFSVVLLAYFFTYIEYGIRPDSLYHLFVIIGSYHLLYYLKEGNENSIISIIYSGIFFGLALMTKQTGIQYYVIILFCSIIISNWKQGLKISLIHLGIIGGIFITMYLIFGKAFISNTITGVQNPTDFNYGYSLWDNFYQENVFLITLFTFSSTYLIFTSESKINLWASILTLATLVFAMLTVTKKGAGISYFSDFIIFGFFPTLIALKQLFSIQRNILNILLALGLLIYFPNQLFSNYYHKYITKISTSNKLEYIEAKELSLEIKGKEWYNDKYIFTPDKHLKNFIPQVSILPNTEYYGVSPYNMEDAKSKFLNHEILIIYPNKSISETINYRTFRVLNLSNKSLKLFDSIYSENIYLFKK